MMEKEKYKEELNNGYTKTFPNAEERRHCIFCGEVLNNKSLKKNQTNLKRHLQTKNSQTVFMKTALWQGKGVSVICVCLLFALVSWWLKSWRLRFLLVLAATPSQTRPSVFRLSLSAVLPKTHQVQLFICFACTGAQRTHFFQFLRVPFFSFHLHLIRLNRLKTLEETTK